MRRVLLIVVDGCTSRLLGPELDSGRLPVLAQLAARGSLRLDCVSIFPSITPAATASIVTGHYPVRHGIAGMSWWDPETGSVLYFGDDVRTVLKRGLGEFLRGFLVHLNGDLLQTPTLFQLVERHGRRAACFNYLLFRGDVAHEVALPLLLRLFRSAPSRVVVHGPSWLCMGDFVASTGGDRPAEVEGGVLNRFGMNDAGTEAFLRHLPSAAALPELTVAYFADYDFDAHDRGPVDALDTLRRLDERLARIFDGWGGLDRVLRDTVVVLTADHSHSQIGDNDPAAIVLDEILSGYRLATPGSGWDDDTQLLLCPNMRAAEVYLNPASGLAQAPVCETILQDPRIDQVIWREAGPDSDLLHVRTRDRGAVRFSRSTGGRDDAADEYGGLWDISGELSAVAARVEDGRLRYSTYPNALERVANGIDRRRTNHLWVTARPGYEFQLPGQHAHSGAGSHGTLHELDSVVPLIVAGAEIRLPATPRIVDVAPICAELIGVPFARRVGESRASD